jgi:hypothetical protein
MVVSKPKYWIYALAKGKPYDETKKVYFNSYAEAKRYIDNYTPGEHGRYHIYPTDTDGYVNSKNRGTSWRTDRARTI